VVQVLTRLVGTGAPANTEAKVIARPLSLESHYRIMTGMLRSSKNLFDHPSEAAEYPHGICRSSCPVRHHAPRTADTNAHPLFQAKH
jgi:hypothetical protein